MGTIAQEIKRIKNGVDDVWDYCEDNGVTVPAGTTVDQARTYLDQIPHGGGGNPFDGVNLNHLLGNSDSNTATQGGRFLNNLDNIYNADRTGMIVDLRYFAYFVSGATSEQAQKIFNIVEKVLLSNTILPDLSYLFNNLSTTDSDREIIFKPVWNNTNTVFSGSRIFTYMGVKNSTSAKMKIILDFENFNVKGINFSGNDYFNFYGDKSEVKIKDFPISNLYGSGTFYFGSLTSAAIKELTVKGGLTNYSSTSVTTLDCRYMSGMALDKWIAFFNSLGSTTRTNATVKIPSAIYSQLTEDQKAIITDKGYLLASA